MSELTEKLTKKEAMKVIAVLVDKNFDDLNNKPSPIHAIIGATSKVTQPRVASYAVDLWLDRFDCINSSSPHQRIQGVWNVVSALNISDHFHLKRETAERLVVTAAHSGFRGRFPQLPMKLLGRSPSPSEVTALVSAYVENKATRCEQDEDYLRNLIQAFVPPRERVEQRQRIEAFIEEWNKPDYY